MDRQRTYDDPVRSEQDMILMAIIMVAPFAALLLFSYFPYKIALPVYIVILIIAGFCYYVMFKSMRAGAKTGMEAMIGQEGLAIEDIDPEGKIEFKDDIWTATARGRKIIRGERVKILDSKGLVLTVESLQEDKRGQNPGHSETK